MIYETSSAAKCKDCNNLRRYYKGKLKRHYCIEFNQNRCLNDLICRDKFDWNPSGTPLSFAPIENPYK